MKSTNPMRVIDDLAAAELRQETVVTIGAFDGVHLGHQALVKNIVGRARATGRLAALVTFHPHPVAVLAPDRAPRYLTTPGEKAALLESLGLDLMILLPFDLHVAATPARKFVEALSQHLQIRELWVGADFALGNGREGDASQLRLLGHELGYRLHAIDPLFYGGEAISSSRIRRLLRDGNVEESTCLLGRYPSLSGEVVTGAQRGHGLGFPTANLEVRPERAIPADGVYAVFALLGSQRYQGVANVGVRPSFDNGHRTVETHLFDFDQGIYGCDLVVEFVARLRPERRFADITDLIAQIQRDGEAARWILGDPRLTALSQSVAGTLDSSRSELPNGLEPMVEGGERPQIGSYRFEEFEHTADRSLWVWGVQPADLFAGSLRGMYSLIGDLEGAEAESWYSIELEGLDRESLLVSWLNELLFLTETEGCLFVEAQIETLTETRLVGRVGGFRGSVSKASIKAATYHDLAVSRDGEGWSTLITFDV